MIVIYDALQRQWLRFSQPTAVVTANHPSAIASALDAVQRQVDRGKYAAGFVAYEAASGCDPTLKTHPSTWQRNQAGSGDFPLLWFGIYGHPSVVSLPDAPQFSALQWRPSISEADYQQAIADIKTQIAQGNTYQVNFSFRLRAAMPDDPWGLFLQMTQAQAADYGAFVDIGDWVIACASPELFFSHDGDCVISRPMKGTAPRGITLRQDEQQGAWLRASEKNQAENAMIVDMVRHDLGRVADIGSISVPSLFELERYPTVWHMTSTVQGRTSASTASVFRSLFPPASITGAPKASTTAIIAQLETTPRHIYTGTIGFMRPDGRSQFNVAIRTVLMDRRRKLAEYGVGGGIVWDSQDHDEYAECCAKAQVLHHYRPRFSLLESLRWTPEEGYFLLERHLERLRQSAVYFGFPYPRQTIRRWLETIVSAQEIGEPQKVRLLLSADGHISGEAIALSPSNPLMICLAQTPVSSSDIFLQHKTTHRQVYDIARQNSPDAIEDVVLWNENGHVTESTLGNIVVELGGQRYTPPLSCGLLPGTFRAHLLNKGALQERIITHQELAECDRIFVVNSVRGWQDAELVAVPPGPL
ncbi:MAG: aminodeoxychorismate synthase component I [Elainellaceae cyanobacterium]